eukprot:2976024-Rhodomonas_salina.1
MTRKSPCVNREQRNINRTLPHQASRSVHALKPREMCSRAPWSLASYSRNHGRKKGGFKLTRRKHTFSVRCVLASILILCITGAGTRWAVLPK